MSTQARARLPRTAARPAGAAAGGARGDGRQPACCRAARKPSSRHCGTAQGLIGSSFRIDAGVLAQAPRLEAISSISVGIDNYDTAELQRRGIMLCHTPGVLTETTADTIFALVMATSRRLVELAAACARGPLDAQYRRIAVRLGRARQDTRHRRLRPHRPGAGAACRARLRHAGAVPQHRRSVAAGIGRQGQPCRPRPAACRSRHRRTDAAADRTTPAA